MYMRSQRILILMSNTGGGHRATVWGAGTILAVSDAGLAHDVTSVSSVSGGSITNGVIAHDLYHAGQIQLLKRLYR